MKRRIAFALSALLACDAWAAQRIVMYRCTDAKGAVIVQNDTPCPKGSKQQKRVVDAPAPAPANMPPPSLPALAPAVPSPPAPFAEPMMPAEAERSPPPLLYRCRTYNKETYFSDTGSPEPRCVALQTVGLDGNPDTGVGRACEMVTDVCKRVADSSLCDAWQLRLLAAETAMDFGKPSLAQANKLEFGRIDKIIRESDCRK